MLQDLSAFIPTIAFTNLMDLPAQIKAYAAMLTASTSQPAPPRAALAANPCSVFQHATMTTLPQHTTNILTDLFPSLRDLCEAVHHDEGRQLLLEYFDPLTVHAIVSFWRA